eukprot:5388986-Amphidinium_carterae.1
MSEANPMVWQDLRAPELHVPSPTVRDRISVFWTPASWCAPVTTNWVTAQLFSGPCDSLKRPVLAP